MIDLENLNWTLPGCIINPPYKRFAMYGTHRMKGCVRVWERNDGLYRIQHTVNDWGDPNPDSGTDEICYNNVSALMAVALLYKLLPHARVDFKDE